MNNPFTIKRKIEHCFALATEYGFELREISDYTIGQIYVYAAKDNMMFDKEKCLEQFPSWEILEAFLTGYANGALVHTEKRKK